MKLILLLATLSAASANPVFPTGQDVYQAALELQQRGYSGQLQAQAHNDVAYQGGPEKNAKILDYKMGNDGHNYEYQYETDNGIKAQEVGQTTHDGTQAQGGYSYTGDDGHVYTVTYTADENGFRASGAHLPTPPPIPEAIAKSLEQNAQAEANGVFDDGKYKPEAEESYQHYEGNNQHSTEHHISQPIQHTEHHELIQQEHVTKPIQHHQIALPVQHQISFSGHNEHQQHDIQPVHIQPINHQPIHHLQQHIAQPIHHNNHYQSIQNIPHPVPQIQRTEYYTHHPTPNVIPVHEGQNAGQHGSDHGQRVTYHIAPPVQQNYHRQSFQLAQRRNQFQGGRGFRGI